MFFFSNIKKEVQGFLFNFKTPLNFAPKNQKFSEICVKIGNCNYLTTIAHFHILFFFCDCTPLTHSPLNFFLSLLLSC